MSETTPLIISVSTLTLELLGEEINFPIPPVVVIASSETELAGSGTAGFVDLATGHTIVQFDDWHDFTARFMQYCQVFDFDPSYCRLALAMGKADKNKQTWEHYIKLARVCSTHYFEMSDPRLNRKKADLEAAGWCFTFLGDHWLATVPGIEICGATLAATIANIHEFGIPTLHMWEEHAAKRGALVMMKWVVVCFIIIVVVGGCVSSDERIMRTQIWANAYEQKAYEDRKAKEAEANATVDKEAARQAGMTERVIALANELPITLVLFGALAIAGAWIYCNHKTEVERMRLGVADPRLLVPPLHQLGGQYGNLPAKRTVPLLSQEPTVIFVRTDADILAFARTVGAELSVDNRGYKLLYPDGRVERLLPVRGALPG